jgi:transposase
MRPRRNFTPEFKAQVVIELISGSRTAAEICRQHQISSQLLGLWKSTFIDRAATLFQDEKHSHENARVAELERLVGRLTLEADVLKKASTLLGSRRANAGR